MKVLVSLLLAVVAVVAAEEEKPLEQAVLEMKNEREIDPSNRGGPGGGPANTTYPPPLTSPARPADCADHLMAGANVSGVYEIFPFTCSCTDPVLVWCDMVTDGGGWTVFLNRQEANPQLDFNRTWDEYKTGFGTPYEEHYMGNEILHVMTHSRTYTMRLDLQLASGGYSYATQETVRVNNEDNRYSMSLSGSRQGTSTTSYAFNYMSGRSFTTKDRDYDSYTGNCATKQGGAWWYYNCNNFNPTKAGFNNTLTINTYYRYTSTVSQLQLKLRPQICDASFKTIHLRDMGCGCIH